MVLHDARVRSLPCPDPREDSLLPDMRLVLEMHRGQAVGNGLLRQPRKVPAELRLRLRMDRSGGQMTEAGTAHQPAHTLNCAADAEPVPDPLPDIGGGPAGRISRIGVGPGLQPGR